MLIPALPETVTQYARSTYVTRELAVRGLEKKLAAAGVDPNARIRYLIAVDGEDRYYPVLVGMDMLPLAQIGLAVVA